MKKNAVCILLVLLAAVTVLALPLRASEAPAVTAPAPAQTSPPVATPAEPSQDPNPTELPESDLFTPKPNYVCLSGWCSSNTQCERWFGPGSVCHKQPGATCGRCID
jgi:hypothetical protein